MSSLQPHHQQQQTLIDLIKFDLPNLIEAFKIIKLGFNTDQIHPLDNAVLSNLLRIYFDKEGKEPHSTTITFALLYNLPACTKIQILHKYSWPPNQSKNLASAWDLHYPQALIQVTELTHTQMAYANLSLQCGRMEMIYNCCSLSISGNGNYSHILSHAKGGLQDLSNTAMFIPWRPQEIIVPNEKF